MDIGTMKPDYESYEKLINTLDLTKANSIERYSIDEYFHIIDIKWYVKYLVVTLQLYRFGNMNGRDEDEYYYEVGGYCISFMADSVFKHFRNNDWKPPAMLQLIESEKYYDMEQETDDTGAVSHINDMVKSHLVNNC